MKRKIKEIIDDIEAIDKRNRDRINALFMKIVYVIIFALLMLMFYADLIAMKEGTVYKYGSIPTPYDKNIHKC